MNRFGWRELPRTSLLVVMAVALTIIAFFSDRAVVEWRTTATRLAEQRANASADLLVNVFNRNMRAVQNSVLAASRAQRFEPGSDGMELIAQALASYSYPEAFFSWQRDTTSPVFY